MPTVSDNYKKMKYFKLILAQLIFIANLNSQMNEITNTYNLYFTSPDLSIGDNCEKLIGPKGDNWQVVNRNNENHIICGGRLDAWDYNVFEFFSRYNDYIPTELTSKFEKEFLFSNNPDLEPSIVFEFFNYLKEYLILNFNSDKHYYIVYDEIHKKEKFKFFFVWERLKFGESRLKISTMHTTFDKPEVPYRDFNLKLNHLDDYKLISVMPKKTDEWFKIPEDNRVEIENRVLLFEKIEYREFLIHRIDKIIATCKIAIEANVKIRRNSDWF